MRRRFLQFTVPALVVAAISAGPVGCASSEAKAWAQTAPAMLPDRTSTFEDVVLLSTEMIYESDEAPARD